MFGGTSAGGVGVIANTDHVAELVYPAKVCRIDIIQRCIWNPSNIYDGALLQKYLTAKNR